MTVVRVGFPALVGAVLALFGVLLFLNGTLNASTGAELWEVRSGVLLLVVGVSPLIAAVAIARRSRAGRLLGLVLSILFALAGLALIAVAIPSLVNGGLGAVLALPVVAIGGVWTLASVGYGLGMWRARSAFAPRWGRDDRGVAIALAVFLGLGAMQGLSFSEAEGDQAAAAALVAATTFEVRVVDARLGQPPADGSSPAVEHLALELVFQNPEAYRLQVAPSLCLLDGDTTQDPAFKPAVPCWGGPGGALVLDSEFADLTISAGVTTIGIELDRVDSICAFAAGLWWAVVTIDPRLEGDSDGGNVTPRQPIRIYASFVVAGVVAGAAVTPCTGLP